MRRLYVGGLNHTVTQKDLKDRFGKFGDVQDVELRTRRDEDGVPYKTFAYININISDADLKKCLTVLNKSRWKGGTLQIEMAKESFLHRLAQEQQAAAEQRLQPPATEDGRRQLLESLSRAGVDNFTMKAAVPGTEVPGHKDWVVSKFGRVLPVLQLSCQKGSRARTVTYDPSKYSHNIRRLDRTAENPSTPVTQLTWEVEGGDDDISKKRRGEFPPYSIQRPKKSRSDWVNSHNALGRTSWRKARACLEELEEGAGMLGRAGGRRGHAWESWRKARACLEELEEGAGMLGRAGGRRGHAWESWRKAGACLGELEEGAGMLGRAGGRRGHAWESWRKARACLEELEEGGGMLGRAGGRRGHAWESWRKAGACLEELEEGGGMLGRAGGRRGHAWESWRKAGACLEELEEGGGMLGRAGGRRGHAWKSWRKAGACLGELEEGGGMLGRAGGRVQTTVSDNTEARLLTNGSEPPTDRRPRPRRVTGYPDSDSDEEIRRLVAAQQTSLSALQQEVEEDNLEVVGLDYLERSLHRGDKDVDGYDSADTDELFAIRENNPPRSQQKLPSQAAENLLNHTDKKRKTKREEEHVDITSGKPSSSRQKEDSSEDDRRKKSVVAVLKPSPVSDSEDEEEVESAGSDSDYEAMFSNVTHLEMSLADLQKLAEDAQQVTETTAPRILEPDLTSKLAERPNPKKGTTPEEILASILEDSSDDEAPKKKKRKRKVVASMLLPVFQGTKSLQEEEEARKKTNQTDHTQTYTAEASSCSSSTEDEDADEDSVEAAPHSPQQRRTSSSEEDEDDQAPPPRQVLGAEEEEELQRKANLRRLAALQQRHKEAEENKKVIQGALSNLDTPASRGGKHTVFSSDDEDEQLMVAELTASKSRFHNSHSEDEAPVGQSTTQKEEARLKLSGPQLFEGSEDEEGGDVEEDGSKFHIRPQFEGAAGQKLMALQSRFGTDERFRMDSRFLEQEEEVEEDDTDTKRSLTVEDEALEDERKKNLSIVQSVLGSSQQTSSSVTPGKAKKFRDVTALHYDPSKEEHAAFETKADDGQKESKSARRRKREEAQKLPEVTKEIYYDVSGDLKAVFGQTKDGVTGGEEQANWDQMEEEEGEAKEEELMSSVLSADLSTKTEESAGFRFSFFDDTEAASGETTEYKLENIQAPKVSWQQDPHFQDSSSEDGEEEEEEQRCTTTKTTEEKTSSKMFFFYPDDGRLKEGPRLFYRTGQLEEQREQWEERRSALRQEYRKKHKDARRKLTASPKS
ncbi:nucleolar protein 8 [Xenentodon cancila]